MCLSQKLRHDAIMNINFDAFVAIRSRMELLSWFAVEFGIISSEEIWTDRLERKGRGWLILWLVDKIPSSGCAFFCLSYRNEIIEIDIHYSDVPEVLTQARQVAGSILLLWLAFLSDYDRVHSACSLISPGFDSRWWSFFFFTMTCFFQLRQCRKIVQNNTIVPKNHLVHHIFHWFVSNQIASWDDSTAQQRRFECTHSIAESFDGAAG